MKMSEWVSKSDVIAQVLRVFFIYIGDATV